MQNILNFFQFHIAKFRSELLTYYLANKLKVAARYQLSYSATNRYYISHKIVKYR